jgi:hypothetical protein
MLFRLGKLSSGAAAEMAGVPRVTFLDLCAEYDIPVSQITSDDLRREMTSSSPFVPRWTLPSPRGSD